MSAADRGLAYGDGLFETILMGPSGPILLDAHLARLRQGARYLEIPCSEEALSFWWQEVERRWRQAKRTTGIVKLIWTRGAGGRGYRPPPSAMPTVITAFHDYSPPPAGGVVAVRCHQQVGPAAGLGYKTLNRLDQVKASLALPPDCFEGILCDPQGRPLEGTRSNLFLFTDEGLLTPPACSLAVVGVMRNFLLENLPKTGISVREEKFGWQDLARGKGLILANSVFGAVPVSQIGCVELPLDNRIARIRQLLEQELGFQFIA